MFDTLRRKLAAAGALTTLCRAAEVEARREGQDRPGAEHFLLAALAMPDGEAARILKASGVVADDLRDAIARQYAEPLKAIGLTLSTVEQPLPGDAGPGLYRAAPSGQALVQALADDRRAPLTSARVLAAAADQRHGVLARALRTLGLDPAALREAAVAA